MNDRLPPCICITGPTACGKTDLALALAGEFPLEVVSMDSAMVYRGLDVGTAKPSRDIRARVPHHLIDILSPAAAYSAGRFAADARQAIGDIRARGRVPLLVGGTLLYLRALRDGLAPLPPADPAIRRCLDREAGRDGWAALHRRLKRIDPAAARRISPADRQRIQRALEVCELTGEPISALQSRVSLQSSMPIRAVALVPDDRGWLAQRIEARFDAMVAEGFVDEVRALMARGDLDPQMPAMRTIGYRQIRSWLDGDCGWEEARRKAIAATRRLAKRQLTWLRSDAAIRSMPPGAPDMPGVIGKLLAELA